LTVCPTNATVLAIKDATVATVNGAGGVQITISDVEVVPPIECTGGVLEFLKRDLSQAQIIIKSGSVVSPGQALAGAQAVANAILSGTFASPSANDADASLSSVVLQGDNSGVKAVSLAPTTGSADRLAGGVAVLLLVIVANALF